jgi:hypothetical protein
MQITLKDKQSDQVALSQRGILKLLLKTIFEWQAKSREFYTQNRRNSRLEMRMRKDKKKNKYTGRREIKSLDLLKLACVIMNSVYVASSS